MAFGFLGKIGSAMKGAGRGAAMKGGAQKPTSGLGRLARTGANMGASFLGTQSRAKYPTPFGQPKPQQPGISGPATPPGLGGEPPQGIQDAQYRGPGQSRWQNPGLGMGGGGFTGWGGGSGFGQAPFMPRSIEGGPQNMEQFEQMARALQPDQQMMGGGQDLGLGPSAQLRRRFGLG